MSTVLGLFYTPSYYALVVCKDKTLLQIFAIATMAVAYSMDIQADGLYL